MGIRIWSGYIIFILIITQSESHWTNCEETTGCDCKWLFGKKAASCIQAGMTEIPSLESDIQVLELQGNPLKVLQQDAFIRAGLPNLHRLNVSSTDLLSVNSNAFRGLSILIELDLSHNKLTQLPPDIFKDTGNLRFLRLNGNSLSAIVAEQFSPLRRLQKLEMSRCNLSAVHPQAFTNLQALETVNIHQNLLTYLHQDTFNLPKLRTLTLSQNPWFCDCRLREFHKWFLRSYLGNEEVVCADPENKSNISWRILKQEDMFCPPLASSSSTVIRALTGTEITFGCLVHGDPKPTVTWLLQNAEKQNSSDGSSEITINEYPMENINAYSDELSRSARWVNVTIRNATSDFSGEWKCSAKSSVGEALAYVTLFFPETGTTTSRPALANSRTILAVH